MGCVLKYGRSHLRADGRPKALFSEAGTELYSAVGAAGGCGEWLTTLQKAPSASQEACPSHKQFNTRSVASFTAMAMRASSRVPSRVALRSGVASAVRSPTRQLTCAAIRWKDVASQEELPNMRHAQRPRMYPEEVIHEQPVTKCCFIAGGKLHAPVVNPADKYQDKSTGLHTYGQYLLSCLPKYIQQFSVWKDELTIYVPPSGIVPVMSFLKYHTAAEYTMVADITAVDYPTKDQRFEVVYNLLSVRHNSRIRVKTYADEATPVPSITGLYDGANWYEREVYDLFGVFFIGHPDLRRIMTDYGFDGHPLRKDFPLTGYTEIRYDEEKKRIVVEPLELTQAFRNFEGGSSAWEQVGPGKDRKPDQVRVQSSWVSRLVTVTDPANQFKLPTPKTEEKKEEQKK